MNPTLLFASIAAAIIGSAQAGYIYIYSPFGGSQCKPGLPCPISWHVSHDGPEFERINIELLSGEAHDARVVSPIVLGYDLSQGNTYIWNVPQGILGEDDYFIRIKGVGTEYESYSHTFPIGFNPHHTTATTDTMTPTQTATSSSTETLVPTRTASISSITSAKKSSTAVVTETSTSAARSVQGSISVAAAVVAAALAVMMF